MTFDTADVQKMSCTDENGSPELIDSSQLAALLQVPESWIRKGRLRGPPEAALRSGVAEEHADLCRAAVADGDQPAWEVEPQFPSARQECHERDFHSGEAA